MRIVCGWCRAVLGFKAPLDDSRTSHGICKTCEDRVNKDLTSEACASTIVPRPPEPDKTPGDPRP